MNKEARNTFRNAIRPPETKAVIPERFRKGPQYEANPDGITPAIYGENPRVVYCPSYNAGNGEFAVNLVTAEARKKLVELLGLDKKQVSEKLIGDGWGGTQKQITYGDNLFAVYETTPQTKRRPPQDSTLYFSKENPIFDASKRGAHLRINIKTGIITPGMKVDLPESRRDVEEQAGAGKRRGRGAS